MSSSLFSVFFGPILSSGHFMALFGTLRCIFFSPLRFQELVTMPTLFPCALSPPSTVWGPGGLHPGETPGSSLSVYGSGKFPGGGGVP